MDYFLILTIASISFGLAAIAFIIALKGLKKTSQEIVSKNRDEGFPDQAAEESSALRRPLIRRVNSLAEAAMILGASALLIFDHQGLAIESYNIAERDMARVAASMAELINIFRSLGFSAETVMLKNGVKSMIVELEKVGDMTLYGLMTGGAALNMNPDYAREVLQKYLESLIERRR